MAIATAILAASCSVTYSDARYSPEELNRRIVDASSGQGIAGAFVVFTWNRRQVDIGHGASTECVRVELVRTDSDGRYKVPDWQGRNGGIRSIFQRGYVEGNDPVASSRGIDKMTRGSTVFAERAMELRRSLILCSDDEDRKLQELYRALLDEARSIARTDDERREVERYFFARVEAATYGREEAFRRLAK